MLTILHFACSSQLCERPDLVGWTIAFCDHVHIAITISAKTPFSMQGLYRHLNRHPDFSESSFEQNCEPHLSRNEHSAESWDNQRWLQNGIYNVELAY